nr:MAG TPA: hypothetical protein [Caudoviricetes sp.]
MSQSAVIPSHLSPRRFYNATELKIWTVLR